VDNEIPQILKMSKVPYVWYQFNLNWIVLNWLMLKILSTPSTFN